MTSTAPILRIVGLAKNFGPVAALRGLTLDIKQGEIFGILGPNGAGKTTLIRILSTLTKPGAGSVLVGGYDVMKNPVEAKRRIGVVHQTLNIDPELSAVESMRIHGMLFNLSRAAIREKTAALLSLVGLDEKRNSTLDSYSGGLKRRLTIARALMHDPDVLIMDEPTAGLDAHARRTVWDLMRRLKRQGRTILLTTHYIEEAEKTADRVAIIDRGNIVGASATCAECGEVSAEVERYTAPLLGRPSDLILRIGAYAVDVPAVSGTNSRFFEKKETASSYLQHVSNDAVMRPSTLEDVFVQTTGKSGVFNEGVNL